jgi:ABC-type branched-subunit amino acid transport system substrate-binding protein
MDMDQGLETVVVAQQAGAKSVVVLAAEIDSFQFAKNAAIAGAKALGMEVLTTIDFQVKQTTYRSMVSKAAALNPDAYLIFCPGEDGGTILKNAAELGVSSIIVGTTDWLFPEFIETATMSGIQQQKLVRAVGFSHAEGPGWDFYESAWKADPVASALQTADNSYMMQHYDILNLTMLALKKAGTTDTASWVKAMFEVAMGPGTKVSTYKEGFDLLSKGEDIDYYGVNGDMNYTPTGVVTGLYAAFGWPDPNSDIAVQTDLIDGKTILDLGDKVRAAQ